MGSILVSGCPYVHLLCWLCFDFSEGGRGCEVRGRGGSNKHCLLTFLVVAPVLSQAS